MEKELSYSDIQLIPRKCHVTSRSKCLTEVNLGKYSFNIPIVPANMKTIITEKLAEYLAGNGYFYIMHRFGIDNFNFVKTMSDKGFYSSISVGVNEDSYTNLKKIKDAKLEPEYITIDIAHGWSPSVKVMIEYIKTLFSNTFVIAGNVCTGEALLELEYWGADCVKVGVANGKVCITKHKTGFGRPSVSTLLDCCSVAKKPIIADGGIEHHGDIAKALVLGARMVMCGNLFAGHEETAGELIEIDDKFYKIYYGSASQYNKNKYKNVEGKKILVPFRGSIEKTLIEIKEDLQSSISYAGGDQLEDLIQTKWVRIN